MHDVHVLSEPARERVAKLGPTTSQSFFARWLARREWDTRGCELVHGRVVRRREPGPRGSTFARRLQRRLAAAAEGSGTVVLEPRQGLELPTGDTLMPDVSVVSAERWANASPSAGDLLRVVPDLVVEVVVDALARPECEARREIYERSGVREYWIADLRTRTITVSVARRTGIELGWVLSGADTLRSPVLPELRLGLGLLF